MGFEQPITNIFPFCYLLWFLQCLSVLSLGKSLYVRRTINKALPEGHTIIFHKRKPCYFLFLPKMESMQLTINFRFFFRRPRYRSMFLKIKQQIFTTSSPPPPHGSYLILACIYYHCCYPLIFVTFNFYKMYFPVYMSYSLLLLHLSNFVSTL